MMSESLDAVEIIDLNSLSGTWERLSFSKQQSDYVNLKHGGIIKIIPYCFEVKIENTEKKSKM
jgi:hypothetical protein